MVIGIESICQRLLGPTTNYLSGEFRAGYYLSNALVSCPTHDPSKSRWTNNGQYNKYQARCHSAAYTIHVLFHEPGLYFLSLLDL